MTLAEVMEQLERAAKPGTAEIYKKHGAKDPILGVLFAELYKLQKAIRVDQKLAEGLWKTGVLDARYLATLIADAKAFTSAQLDQWVADCDHYGIVDLFARFIVARGPHARAKADKWTGAKDEWTSSAGWGTVAALAMGKDTTVDEAWFAEKLVAIEKGIAKAPNRTRYAMNSALIAIGGKSEALRTKAIAAAKRIGPVKVDHGETGCKTPEAIEYIGKMWERNKPAAPKAGKSEPAPKRRSPPRARA